MKTVVTNKCILLYNSIYSSRWYAVMWHQVLYFSMVCSHVASSSVLFAESGDTTSLFANKEGSSSERRMEGGIADETSMPPLKCECVDSAA